MHKFELRKLNNIRILLPSAKEFLERRMFLEKKPTRSQEPLIIATTIT